MNGRCARQADRVRGDDHPKLFDGMAKPGFAAREPPKDTKQWWRDALSLYDLVVSQPVLEECGEGDTEAAIARLAALSGIAVLPESDQALSLSVQYIQLLKLPGKAIADALHIAYATVFELDYLLTWNMRHLASSLTMRRLTEYNVANSLHVPLIVTPESLEALKPGIGEDADL